MTISMRNGFLAVTAAVLMACGGASTNEEIGGGTSRLDGKDPGGTATGTKDPNAAPCEKPGDPTDPVKDPGACFGVGEGSATSCKTASDWKTYANDTCTAKGAALTALGFAEECDKDSYRYAKFECCTATAGDPNVDPKEPPKDPGTGDPTASCTGEYLDGLCQSEADWKNTASQACAKSGLALSDLYFGSVCGKNGEIGEVKFTCCK